MINNNLVEVNYNAQHIQKLIKDDYFKSASFYQRGVAKLEKAIAQGNAPTKLLLIETSSYGVKLGFQNGDEVEPISKKFMRYSETAFYLGSPVKK